MDEQERPEVTEEIRQKKRMVWLITAAMLVASCLGTAVLMLVLWLVLRGNIPPA